MARAIAAWVTQCGRERPVASAAVLYGILAIALLGPGLLPGHTISGSDYLWSAVPWSASKPPDVRIFGANPDINDAVKVFQPFQQYTHDRLPHVPLWNPYIMAGRPFLADGQSAVFSPYSAPAYILPFWWSLSLIAALKVFVAAFGTFLLGRALGLRYAGALLAGLTFGFSLYFVVWLPWPLTSVWSILPWLLLVTDRLVRRPGVLPASALAALVAVQYVCGHPESSFHVMFATSAFAVFRLLQLARGRLSGVTEPAPTSAIAYFVGALVGGAALAAAAIVPFVELLVHSADISRRNSSPQPYVPLKYMLGLFMPDYYGRATQTPLESFDVVRGFYLGALPLMLGGIALVVRRSAERIALAVFAAFVLLMVLGAQPVFDLVTALPGFHASHNHRMAILFVLCISLLAGWGFDDLIAARLTRRQRTLAILVGLAILLFPPIWVLGTGSSSVHFLGRALDVAWGFRHPPAAQVSDARPIIRLSTLIVWLTFAGIGFALLAMRLRGRLAAPLFTVLVIGFLACDLFRAGMGRNPAETVGKATQPTTGAIRYLQARRPARFAGVPRDRGPAPIPPNVAMRYGLYDVRGYDLPVDKRYDRLFRRWVFAPNFLIPGEFLVRGDAPALRILNLLGVRDIVQSRRQLAVLGPGIRLAYDGPDARIYESSKALPRVFLPAAQKIVASEGAALEAIGAPGFDGRRVVISEERLPRLPQTAAAGGVSGGAARLLRYEPERVTVAVSATRPAELVLSDVSFPGWEATVDGRTARLDRVDYLLRGVPVGPGSHRVEFRYRPRSWTVGLALSLASLLALGVVAGYGLLRAPRADG